jgi:predicted phage terminase large subunit-like protein
VHRQRIEQKQQAALPYISLADFVRKMWHVLEPDEPYIHNWHIDYICQQLEAVTRGETKRLVINIAPRHMKSLLVSVMWPCWEWGQLPGKRWIFASYVDDVANKLSEDRRTLLTSDAYQRQFPGVVTLLPGQNAKSRFTNTRRGTMTAASFGGRITGLGAHRIVVDDPTSPKEADSAVERAAANTYFGKTLMNRLNQPAHDAVVIVMQRLHEDDLTGHVSKNPRWKHIVLPTIAEKDEAIRFPDGETVVERREGDLLWPERFTPDVIEATKIEMGPYGFACTPGESPILMADLTYRRIADVQPGDMVVGFTEAASTKRKLTPAQVKGVYKYHAPVVKMTMASGRTIRCTSDHKWFTGRSGKDHHLQYASAKVGSTLRWVADVHALEPLTPAQERTAGWVAGFFDGEGSCSTDSGPITFCQGIETHPQLVERLEQSLTELGFDWGYTEREGYNERWQAQRLYYLRGGMEMVQRFVHLVQPSKWRERMIGTVFAAGARFVRAKDRVVSIEPDGEETVYALETETGNYIVWGYASSNSQHQQRPAPITGGVIHDDWWRWYDPVAAGPILEQIAQKYVFCDTAFKEGQENDYSVFAVWGRVFPGYQLPAGYYLLDLWRDRKDFPALRHLAVAKHQQWKPWQWLIEDKGSGQSLLQELQLQGLPVLGYQPVGDKLQRLVARTGYLEAGLAFLPKGAPYLDAFLKEHRLFPKDVHDDMVDTTSMMLDHFATNVFDWANVGDMRGFMEEAGIW